MSILEITGPDYLPELETPTILSVGEESVVLHVREKDLALFAFIGAIVSDSQVFEFQVGGFLTAVQRTGSDPKKIDVIEADYSNKTIGWLANAFKKHCNDSATAEALERARIARNYVVHEVLKKYGWWHMQDQDYLSCLRDIREAREALWDGKEALIRQLNDTNILRVLFLPLKEYSST